MPSPDVRRIPGTIRQTNRILTRRSKPKGVSLSADTVVVSSDLFPHLVGLLWPFPYAVIMKCIISRRERVTTWICHVETGFSIADCAAIFEVLCGKGFIVQRFDPTPFGGCAIGVYECAATITLIANPEDPETHSGSAASVLDKTGKKKRSKRVKKNPAPHLIRNTAELVSWASNHTGIRVSSQ